MMRSCTSTLTNSAIGVFLEDIINHKLHSAAQKKNAPNRIKTKNIPPQRFSIVKKEYANKTEITYHCCLNHL